MKRKALIHIGGSYLQLPGIHWAKDLGFHVILTDRNYEAPGRLLADQFELISGADVPRLVELAQQLNGEYELVGAYASNDFGLPAVAAIAEALGRPGFSRLAVARALNKSVSKDMWRQENLPTPKGVLVKDHKALASTIDELGLPVILKPTESSGSQGVRSVWDSRDLQQAYTGARQFSESVLVEQLVFGRHFDVNGMFVESDFFPCGTMDRFFSEPPYHYPIWGCQPSSLGVVQEETVYNLVERAARALSIEDGPFKADVVWTDDGPVILELAPRFHGDVSTAYVTPLATGGSPIKAWLSCLMGSANPLEYLGQGRSQFAGWMALFPLNYGKLLLVDGVDAAKAINDIQDIFIAKKTGDVIKQATDNTALCGFVWATADNRDELLENLTGCRSIIRFITE